jgi:hypothetical protein
METFKIKSSSWVLFILTLMTVLIGGVLLAIKIFPTKNNPGLALPIVLGFFILAYFATKLTSIAIIEVTLTDQTIYFKWFKNYLFQSNSEWTINWSDIVEYKFQRDRNFDLLKLKLADGQTFRIWHNNGFTKDDFYNLVSAFEKRVLNYNEAHSATPNIIKRGRTIYETTAGLVLAIIAGLSLFAIPILIYFLPSKAKINWAGFGVAYAGGLFFIGQVIYFRRKKAAANKSIAASGAGQ